MPELPEVEIIKQSLKRSVQFKKIINVIVNNKNLRFKIKKNLKKNLINKRISNITRKSKYLIVDFKNMQYLVIHFGMSGTLHYINNNNKFKTNLSFYHSQNLPKKHNHVHFIFNKFKIIYNDPRRFGFIRYFSSKSKLNYFFENKGPEPFEKKFNFFYLKKKLSNKKKNIKNFLLDQKFVSGIGNIYASEILFYSKINPLKKGKDINNKEIKKIIKYSRFVLKKAIKKGGSTIRDFKNSRVNKGSYQNEFIAYSRENKICKNIKCKQRIIKIIISSRSTYMCKYCQK